MKIKTSKKKLVSKNNNIANSNNNIRNIKRFSGSTENIVVRDFISNEIIKTSTLRKKRNASGGIGKNIRESFKKGLNNSIDNLANKKVLRTVELDEDAHIDIGSNAIKSKYNTVVAIKHSGKGLIKTAKVVKRLPKNIKNIATNIKSIPSKIRTAKKITKKSAKDIVDVGSKIAKGDFKGAGKQIGKGLVKGSKNTYKLGKKIARPSFKIVNIVGRVGTRQVTNNFKNKIKSKEIEDIGSNAVVNLMSGSKNSVLLGAKAIRTTRNVKRNVKKIKSKLKTRNLQKSKIKTAAKHKNLNKKVQNINKFAAKAQKQASKAIQNMIKIAREIFARIIGAIVGNPITIGIIAGIIVVSIIFQILMTSFIGVHGSLTIDFGDGIDEWKTQMQKMDQATNQKIHSGDGFSVTNSQYNTTWKEVLAVYSVKYDGDMKLSNDSSTGGTNINTINPQAWEKIYGELKSYLGENYVYGGSTPETGFDCSGFVQYCYGVGGIQLPRTTYEQCEVGEDVTNKEWQPGDLLFFMGSDPQNGLPGHIGVYVGDNEYIHAPSTGDVIKISEVTGRNDLWGVKRVITSSGDSGKTSSDSNSSSNLYQSMNGTYADLFNKVGQEYGVDPILLASIAMQESSLDPNSVSSAGACGLCQFMPGTFTDLGFSISQIFDPYTNVSACAVYLKELLNTTNGDLTAALQCYNLGPNAYKSCGGDVSKMPQETQEYAERVYSWYKQFSNGGIPNGSVSSSTSVRGSVSSKLKGIYDLFNTVTRQTSKHKDKEGNTKTKIYYTLTKHSLKEVEESLKMTQDEKDLVQGILDYDNFDDFGTNYDFRFKYKIN